MKSALRLTVFTLLLAASDLPAATHYVSLGSTNPTPPYTNWGTAATNIQQAVGVAAAGDVVVVTNGVYPGGVSVAKPLTLQSVNGPETTVIDGYGGVRCVFLTDRANLFGFTLARGVAVDGGGVYCQSASAVLSNCVLTGNSANDYDGMGGGACGGTLYNCTLTGNSSAFDGGGASGGPTGDSGCILNNCKLTGNSAAYFGGGAQGATLNNCTLTGNWSGYGGGAAGCTLNNCIVYNNSSTNGANYDPNGYSTLNYSCTTPLPTNGFSNITNAPLFVDYAGGNLRLQSNSPCINAGNNAYVTNSTDLDGRRRIVGGTVDMGAYEFQPGVSGAFIGWLQQYSLPTDGSADFIDSDGDGMNNWQEWVCGTCPTNAQSVLRLLSPSVISTNATVTWQSVSGVNYFLGRSANLASPFMLLATNVVGQAGTTSYADTNATGAGPFFYRVGVKSP